MFYTKDMFKEVKKPVNEPDYQYANSIHELHAKNLKGEYVKLDKYKGHVCLIVNVASKCRFAEINYKQLNEVYEKYAENKGLRILAFPCNQFANGEPGTSEDIMRFAESHGVKFDMFEKVDVNSKNAAPLYKFLKLNCREGQTSVIKWNFTKFIVNKYGFPIKRYNYNVMPLEIVNSLKW